MRLKKAWKNLFGRYLLVTNTVSSGALLGLGDVIQQKIERMQGINKSDKNDWKRTGKLFIVGLSQGPPHHYFYIWLDKVIHSLYYFLIIYYKYSYDEFLLPFDIYLNVLDLVGRLF